MSSGWAPGAHLPTLAPWRTKPTVSDAHHAVLGWSGSTGGAYAPHAKASGPGKAPIPLSPAATYGGDGVGWNPEELFAASLGYCHMLTFLALAKKYGLDVRRYDDDATATLGKVEGLTRVVTVRLAPTIALAAGDPARAADAFTKAHKYCFIGQSVRCDVQLAPTFVAAEA